MSETPPATEDFEATGGTGGTGGSGGGEGLSRTRQIIAAGAAAGALAASLLLLWMSLRQGATLPGCGGGESALDCGHVLRSRWSTVLSLPVSALAAALYVAVLGALAHAGQSALPRRRAIATALLHTAATMIVGAAAWFIALQAADGKFCLYCMIAHSLGLLAAACILWRPARGAWKSSAAGIVGVALLVGGQLAFPPAGVHVQQLGAGGDFDRGSGADRQISILGGRVALRPAQFPMLGQVDAPHVMVYLFDYTCPYCRLLHGELEQLRGEFQGDLAIVVLPVPMHPACNPTVATPLPQHESACELAKLSMAVWRAKPEAWPAYNHWLVQGEDPPAPGQAREQAITLLDAAALDAALADPWIDEQIARNVKLHELSGAGVVPTLIIRHVMLLARPTRAELLKVLDEDLGIRPPR